MNCRLVLIASGVSALVALILLVVTGQTDALTVGDPGVITRWGLPAVRAVDDLLGAFVLGLLLVGNGAKPSPRRKDETRSDTGAITLLVLIAAWFFAAAGSFVLTVSDIAGRLDVSAFVDVVTETAQGPVFVFRMVFIAVVALAVSNRFVAVPAMLAQLTVVFAGHAVAGERSTLSVLSLLLHVGAVSVWVGVVAALVLLRRRPDREVVRTVSRWAGIAFVLVALSGLVNAALRLGGIGVLFTTSYGRLVMAKLGLLIVLGSIGAVHRRWFVGRGHFHPSAFLRLVGVEVVIMAVTIGVAVALSRSVPPGG